MIDGREVTRVVDSDGGIIQSTLAAPRITVSYERKISDAHGLPQYESAVAYAAVQADVALDGSDRVSAITEAFQIAKSAVFAQLGLQSTVDDVGTVIEKLIASTNATPVNTINGPRPRSTGTTPPKNDAASLWRELESNPGKFFDNRLDKKNPAGPDFKRKGTGEGLWIADKDGTNNPDKYGVTLA